MGSQRRDAQTRIKEKLTTQLDKLTADLQAKGLEAVEIDRQTKVRHLRAELRQVHHRLQAIDALEARAPVSQAQPRHKRKAKADETDEAEEASAPVAGQPKGRRDDNKAAKPARRAAAKGGGEESEKAPPAKRSRRRDAAAQADSGQPDAERKSKKRVKPERKGPRQGSPRGGGRGARTGR
jgi:hypothetical protein